MHFTRFAVSQRLLRLNSWCSYLVILKFAKWKTQLYKIKQITYLAHNKMISMIDCYMYFQQIRFLKYKIGIYFLINDK